MLDLNLRWDRELSQDEQLVLAFARILVQAPSWALIDDIFGSLDDEALARVVDVFTHELAHTAVIHIRPGGAGARSPVLTRAAPGQGRGAAHGSGGDGMNRGQLAGAGAAAPGARCLAALALALMLGWLPLRVHAQEIEFHPPATARDERALAAMRDLAQRVLPVYQE